MLICRIKKLSLHCKLFHWESALNLNMYSNVRSVNLKIRLVTALGLNFRGCFMKFQQFTLIRLQQYIFIHAFLFKNLYFYMVFG